MHGQDITLQLGDWSDYFYFTGDWPTAYTGLKSAVKQISSETRPRTGEHNSVGTVAMVMQDPVSVL